MSSCPHRELILLPQEKEKLRCRHCHLVIRIDELGEGYCPECFEETGERRREFDEVKQTEGEATRYRCAACGMVIEG